MNRAQPGSWEEHQQNMATLREEGVRLAGIGDTSKHGEYRMGVVLRPRGVALGEIDDSEHPKFFLDPNDAAVPDPFQYVNLASKRPVYVYATRVRELRLFILMAEQLCRRGVWVTAV